MIAGKPKLEVSVPASATEVMAGRPARLIWRNEDGGLTFEITDSGGRQYLKWAPAAEAFDAERARLEWAAKYRPVPRVLRHGSDEHESWLLTAGLPGDNAVSDRWLGEPGAAVRAIGRGLRALHDELPVENCPFTWSAAERVADARQRSAEGRLDPSGWHPEFRQLSIDNALLIAGNSPPVDRLVVCHGDACAPNTLLNARGECTGHVDLGTLGIADRWADLAVATWSTAWNYGPGWQNTLLEAYGVDPDPGRIAYYRLLWDLGP